MTIQFWSGSGAVLGRAGDLHRDPIQQGPLVPATGMIQRVQILRTQISDVLARQCKGIEDDLIQTAPALMAFEIITGHA